MSLQSVVIRFHYGKSDMEPLYELEERIAEAVEESGAGDYDGMEMSMDSEEGEMSLTGPDAHALLEAISPVLESVRFMRGAEAELRLGPDEDSEAETVVIGG